MPCSKHQRHVPTCPYCQDAVNAIVAANVERDRDALLEALKEAAECLEHSVPAKGTYTDRTLKLARAAIKKAEGTTEHFYDRYIKAKGE